MAQDLVHALEGADVFARDHCCANCWGHLIMDHVLKEYRVVGYKITCYQCGDATPGYILTSTTDALHAQQLEDALTLKRTWEKAAGVDKPDDGKTAENHIDELGY